MRIKNHSAIILLLLGLSVPFCSFAANPLWFEGKDRSQDQVNIGMKALTPEAYLNVAEKFDEAVVNINTTKVTRSRSGQGASPFPHGPRSGQQNPFGGPSPFGDLFERFFGGPVPAPPREFRQQSLGSGFILNQDGYIVTNNHVVEQGDEIKVLLLNQKEYLAKVIGRDNKTDVALLKIEVQEKLPHVILGDSDQLRVGEVVMAIGNPFGLSHSLTQGIVSAKERSIGFGQYDDFIQTDASINPGNSGGPLLNLRGEVVGINTAIVASGQGIGFAIPINLAKGILKKLHQNGRVVRGWLGVMIQPITDELAKSFQLPQKQGALVAEVQKDSPAAKSNLRPGDVILRFDGKEVKEMQDLPMMVASTDVGKNVVVEVYRDGKRKNIRVVLGELKDSESPTATADHGGQVDLLGLVVAQITPEMGLDPDLTGVVITDIDEESPAYAKGIRVGEVVLEINRQAVTSLHDYRKAVSGKKKGDTVVLRIKRDSASSRYVAFTLK